MTILTRHIFKLISLLAIFSTSIAMEKAPEGKKQTPEAIFLEHYGDFEAEFQQALLKYFATQRRTHRQNPLIPMKH